MVNIDSLSICFCFFIVFFSFFVDPLEKHIDLCNQSCLAAHQAVLPLSVRPSICRSCVVNFKIALYITCKLFRQIRLYLLCL